MKKRILSIILLGCMAVSLMACSNNTDINSNNTQQNEIISDNNSINESGNDTVVNKEFEITDDSVFEEITYEVGGFEFYCPKVFKNGVNAEGYGFLLEKKNLDMILGYEKREVTEYTNNTVENRYVILTISSCHLVLDDEDRELVSTVTLDNMAELTKDRVLDFFADRYYLLQMSKYKIDMSFDKSEKVTINGIDMLKLEGCFKDMNGIKEDVPFYAYYMISENENGERTPVHYIGFPYDGTYEEVVNYMDTYINKVQCIK